MSGTLQIKLLGGFSLIYANQPVMGATTDRLQSLLAYLLLDRQTPQSRQRLAFEFWPDSTDAQARTNLRRELHYLRQTLPDVEHFLQIDAKTLQWKSDGSFSLDVADFEQAFERAATAAQASQWEQARTEFEQAIALYRGELLPHCEGEWIIPERDRLQQVYLRALE